MQRIAPVRLWCTRTGLGGDVCVGQKSGEASGDAENTRGRGDVLSIGGDDMAGERAMRED